MIVLNSTNSEILGLTYWKLKSKETQTTYTMSRDEKELLRKILLAINIKLNNEMLEIKEGSIAHVTLPHWLLVFDSVDKTDSGKIIHLSKLSTMLEDKEQKKHTWHKLKNLMF